LCGALAVTTALAGVGCGEQIPAPIEELRRDSSITEGRLIEANNTFAFNLFREVIGLDDTANAFISPLSVAMAPGMAYNGAVGGALEAMQRTLQLQELDVDQVDETCRSLIDLLSKLDSRVESLLAKSIWYCNQSSRIGRSCSPFLNGTRARSCF
jgi:serine protease inhibitor